MTGYLPDGMPVPVAAPDGLDAPYHDGLAEGVLRIQRCRSCDGWQWGPEWICHRCHSFDLRFDEVEAAGTIYSHQRVHHPVHPALADHGPYVVVLVELPQAGGARVVGNLLGDPMQPLHIGAAVEGVFEHHRDHEPPYTLLQWQVVAPD